MFRLSVSRMSWKEILPSSLVMPTLRSTNVIIPTALCKLDASFVLTDVVPTVMPPTDRAASFIPSASVLAAEVR